MSDEVRESCGLFGILGHPDAATKTYYGLFGQQHRGQESAGMAVVQDGDLRIDAGMGLVQEVFSPDRLQELVTDRAVGHVRYSTTGGSNLQNAQPMLARYARGQVAIAHNGNLTNSKLLRAEAEARGSIFQTTADSEAVLHLLARPTNRSFEDHLVDSLSRLEGAFSFVLLTSDRLIGVRDPHGWRPLVVGRVDDVLCLASETCALDLVGAERVRDVEPGEVVLIDEEGLRSRRLPQEVEPARCAFEYVYFSRPDSRLFGQNVQEVRKDLGRELAREHPVEADAVISIPDSGNAAALGYAEASGIPFDFGMVRNHYVGRTFIHPVQRDRVRSVNVKLNVVREVVEGRRLVVVDDSVVRGTTARSRVALLREAGASEIHFRVSCPPIRHPCYYGIDFPTREELIAHERTPEEIAELVGVDSIGYLSLEGLHRAVGEEGYCTACWSGDYPVEVPDGLSKEVLEQG